MRPIKISITQAHIRDGVRGDKCNCPIALAIKDTLITESVSVDPGSIWINNVSYVVESKDRRFMERFDQGMRVKPYSFTIARKKR